MEDPGPRPAPGLIRGRPVAVGAMAICRLAGEANCFETSTNNLPPAAYMRPGAVNWRNDSPKGFIASVIIC